MQKLVWAAAVFAALAAPVRAEEKYDRKIDEAAARIVADRIGDIRGGFGAEETPVFVPAVSRETTGSVRHRFRIGWVPASHGMARLADPRPARVIVF